MALRAVSLASMEGGEEVEGMGGYIYADGGEEVLTGVTDVHGHELLASDVFALELGIRPLVGFAGF